MFFGDPTALFLLTLLMPILLGLFSFAFQKSNDENKSNGSLYQKITLFTLVTSCLSPVYMIGQSLSFPWVRSLGINFSFHLDSLSFVLIIFTNLIFLLYSLVVKKERPVFYLSLIVLQFALFGIFTSTNLVVFYFFYELLLLPAFYFMYIRGDSRSKRAALQFLLYTVFGSLLMLVAIASCGLEVYQQTGRISFEFNDLFALSFSEVKEKFLMLAFFVAFAIKAPIFPFHGWLPAAYSGMPHRSAIIIAAVLFQAGLYGIFRFVIFLFPNAYLEFAPIVATLAVIGIVYGSLLAWRQETIRGVLSYASIAHVGFSVLGLSLTSPMGMEGAMILIVSHVLIAGGLFALASFLIERTGSEKLADYQGLAAVAPRFAVYIVAFSLTAISLPLTLGFVGEFQVLAAAYSDYPYHTVFALLGVVLGAVYMLKLCQQILYGKINQFSKVDDLNQDENIFLGALLSLLIFLGIFPGYLSLSIKPVAEQAAELITPRVYKNRHRNRKGSLVARKSTKVFVDESGYLVKYQGSTNE